MWKWIVQWWHRAKIRRQRELDALVARGIDTLLTSLDARQEAAGAQERAWQEELALRQALKETRHQKELHRLAEEKARQLAKEEEAKRQKELEERIQQLTDERTILQEELNRLTEEHARRQIEQEKAYRNFRIGNGTMRCALCLSGFMRFVAGWHPFKDLLTHMQRSFYDLNCDIFVSTWHIAGIQKGKDQTFAWRWPEIGITPELVKSLYGDRLKDFQIIPYDPRRVTPDWLLKHAHTDMHLSQRLSSMYYHVYETNRLKNEYAVQQGFKYDITIRCRSDLNFHQGKASDVIKKVEYKENRVFVPHCESYGYTNDQFMFGYSDAMDKVADLYNHIVAKSPMILHEPEGNPMHPAEYFFQTYLTRQGLEVVKCAVGYTRSS